MGELHEPSPGLGHPGLRTRALRFAGQRRIRGFEVTVKGEQIRAEALVPGPVGRKVKLQQLDGRRWVTLSQSRTERVKGAASPRVRWRVDVADLRVPNAGSRAQAGPLADLVRLRAKAGQQKSKPKKVRVRLAMPAVPELVIGKVSGRQSQDGFEMEWEGSVTFRYLDTVNDRIEFARYKLDSAYLSWSARGSRPDCTLSGTGSFTMPALTGDGVVFVPKREGGSLEYQFTLAHDTALPITYACKNGDTGTFDLEQTLSVNTLGCPSAGSAGIFPRYSALPWISRQDLWRFSGEVATDLSGLCSDGYNPPGFMYAWDLTGTDPMLLTPE